ncbi:glycosyltransferase [bacterium]|nr:glycosyltransferase [bacterium]
MLECLVAAWCLLAAFLQGVLALNIFHLAFVTVGAWLSRRFPRPGYPVPDGAWPRLAVLVAAHDEAAVIGACLSRLREQEYPAERVATWVVADRCADATAGLARAAGATVFEREDGTPSKGAALAWLWERLGEAREGFDAVVVLDADNEVAPDFLAEMGRALASGAKVVQGQRIAKNPQHSAASALDGLAEALHHRVVAAGLSWWGFSTSLSGSGVAYERRVFERLIASTTTQVEDCEYQLRLLGWGVAIRSAPGATVFDEKIHDFEAMARQRSRWIQGKLRLFARHLPGLVWGAMNGRREAFEGLGFVATSLPRSVLVVLLGLGLLAGAVGVPGVLPWPWWLGGMGLFGLHVASGLVIAGVNPAEWKSLMASPRFIRVLWGACWQAMGRRRIPWVRTPHGSTDEPPA